MQAKPQGLAPVLFPPAFPTELRPGDTLDGRYVLNKKLGRGSMSEVWLAQHKYTKLPVVIKTVRADEFAKASTEERNNIFNDFRSEGAISNIVDQASDMHFKEGPHGIKALDFDVLLDGRPYLVVEKLEGNDMFESIGALPPVEVAGRLADILRILEKSHERGYVYRDLKPDNVFITDAGDTRLIDYGLSAPIGAKDIVGTRGYWAPEQTLGKTDIRSDIYSAGALGYALMSNKLANPVDGKMIDQLLPKSDQIFADYSNYPYCPVPPLRSVAPNVPEHIANAIDRALSCDPQGRYQTAAAFRADLESAISEELRKRS